ncbi:RHS repeat-associated core domain-containing protein [Empedobacter sp.]|nr:RHS repeat-associated core domain-containing protein [Empedobacter sp.]
MNSIYLKNTNEAINAYNETIKGYDKNGNITGIIRNGNNEIINAPVIDNLSYVYQTNSNKLLSVTDATTLTEGFNDGNKVGNDYAYDVNGNLTVDKNKGITKISYNYLNLPTEVLWNASKKINYTYDASGVKLRKVVTDGATVTTTDYLGGFQYVNNSLQFFPTAEGYVNVTGGTTFNYVYNYTDHLGNVRLSYQKEANGTLKVLEENNYYPFGLKHKGYNNTNLANTNYKYKYNGKELQEELGLNWTAMDFRNYDASIGRFMSQDGLAEVMPDWTPYRFSFNNPIYFSDPTGLFEQNIETCPTCPKTPEFKPFIDDPNNEYVYDTETNTVSAVIQLAETTVTNSNKKESNTNSYIPQYEFIDGILNNKYYDLTSLGLEQGIAKTTSYLDKALKTKSTVNFTILDEYTRPSYRTSLLNSAIKTSKVASAAKVLKISGNALAGVGAVVSIYQYGSGQISGTEFTVDMIMSGVGFLGPFGAGASLIYFGGKAIYEYSSGKDLFEKPTQ